MGRSFKVVILGGGTAAGYAALEFVKLGVNHGEVCMISDESVVPYERPALSKGYLLPDGETRLPFFYTCVGVGEEKQSPKWYKDQGIEVILDTPVVTADVQKKSLLTASQETIFYETLIVATGASAMKLEDFGLSGSAAPNICYLRSFRDAELLLEEMKTCKESHGRAVVIGGGYIGMECAAALTTNGISVTMVFPEAHCIARLFTEEISSFYEDYYKRKGVSFKKGTIMSGFEQDTTGKVVAVLLKDGCRLPTDLVVVGVGIRPNVALFEGQLAMEKGGIKVNGKMQTSNKSVYAVGDVVTFRLKMYQDVRRVEHVDHARKSAAHAVRALLSPRATRDYDYLPFFYSRVFSLSWQFFGDNVGTCVIFGKPSTGTFGAYWVNRGRIVGAFMEGGTKDEYEALRRLARDRPEIKDLSLLRVQGSSFAISHCSSSPRSCQTSIIWPTMDPNYILGLQASYTMQVAAGVLSAVAIAGFAYWYGRRRRKWL